MTNNKIVARFDLTKVIKKEHKGKWVALSTDYKKVVASDKNILRLERQVGERDVVYLRAMGGSLDAGYCL